MTVAPAFFIVGMIIGVAFLVLVLLSGLGLSCLGKRYPRFKLHRPVFSVFLVAVIALAVQLFFTVPQIVILSLVPGTLNIIPPYYLCFFIVGLIVFSIRLEGKHSGRITLLYAACLSLACVLFFYLIEIAFLLYIQTPRTA